MVIPSRIFLVINKKKWNKLSKKDQIAINSVSGESLAKLAGRAWDNADKKGMDMSKNNGVGINTLSEKDKVLAKNILMPIIATTLDKISKDKGIDAHKIYSKLLKEIELIKNE